MRAGLTICDQRVERDACEQRGFAILARHLDIGGAESPESIGAFPAEDGSDHELLPWLQHKGLAGPFPGRVPQVAEKLDRVQRGGAVPREATGLAGIQVLQMPCAGQLHQPARSDLAAGDCLCIGGDRARRCLSPRTGFTRCCHGSDNPRTGRGCQSVQPCAPGCDWMASSRTHSRSGPSARGIYWPPPGTGSG